MAFHKCVKFLKPIYISLSLAMVDKLKEAALILKATVTKDEVEKLLLEATSEDNWQTPTTVLHGLADAAYNYDQWQKISSFIWEKLKSKKWKKVLKTLNLIEFLLKNGPPSILSTFKYEVYQFRSFDGYNCYDDGIDRGQAIREKAKSIVDLLTNEELLEEERVKAKTIRERLAGASSQGMYSGMGSSSTGSRYGGTNYKNQTSKYAGYGSGSKAGFTNSGSAPYSTGSYDEGKSTLNKYKNYSGTGGVYAKDNLNKDKKEEKVPEPQKKQEEVVAPKPFQKAAPTLKKPGEIKPPPLPQTTATTNTTTAKQTTTAPTAATAATVQLPKPAQQQSDGFDFFSFDSEPAKTVQPPQPQVAQPVQPTPPPQAIQPAVQQPAVQQPAFHQPVAVAPVQQQTHPLVNPMYATTAQMASLNLSGQQPQPTAANPAAGGYPAHVNPMYPTTAPLAFPGFAQQQAAGYPAHVNPMYPTTAPLAAGYSAQLPQHMPTVASHYAPQPPVQQPVQQPAQQAPKAVSGFTMSTGPSKPVQPKDEDEFGGFESSNKGELKIFSKDQSNLIDLNDLGTEIKEKKKDDGLRKQPQVKKKQSGTEGSLLATAEDFESFNTGPTLPAQSYNISMNINNVNFGVPVQQSRPVVDPLHIMGNVMGGMQYPGYGQGYQMGGHAPQQMTPQQYQQYMQQQQQFGYRH